MKQEGCQGVGRLLVAISFRTVNSLVANLRGAGLTLSFVRGKELGENEIGQVATAQKRNNPRGGQSWGQRFFWHATSRSYTGWCHARSARKDHSSRTKDIVQRVNFLNECKRDSSRDILYCVNRTRREG